MRRLAMLELRQLAEQQLAAELREQRRALRRQTGMPCSSGMIDGRVSHGAASLER